MINMKRIFRMWSYTRIGYPVYISFFVAIGGNLVIVSKLLFPGQNPFELALVGGIALLSTSALLGWVHTKKIRGFKTDVEINPYNYLMIPGKEKEVVFPLLIAIAEKLEISPELVRKARELK